MGLYSEIRLSGASAGLINRGKIARIQAIVNQTDEISRHEAHEAFERIGELTVGALEKVSPVGKSNPGTLDHGGLTPPRARGTLRRSWTHRVATGPDGAILRIFSTDPVSEYVDKGTGIYRMGGGGSYITPGDSPVMAIPASHLKIGGSRARRGGKKVKLDVRWMKSVRGQPAQHIVTRAQITVRPLFGPILRAAAYRVKRELVRELRST